MEEATRVPIIRLHDDLIVSVQIALSDNLVLQLKEDISYTIQQCGARGLIIDLSGVDILDSYISRVLYDIASIAKLMGVQTVICGLDPAMASTLVEMDVELVGLNTELSLEAAIERLDLLDQERARVDACWWDREVNADPDEPEDWPPPDAS